MSREVNWITPADDMTGYHIWCFHCKGKVASKTKAKQDHMNHDVDWVHNQSGIRYMFQPDGSVPFVGINDGFDRDKGGRLRSINN